MRQNYHYRQPSFQGFYFNDKKTVKSLYQPLFLKPMMKRNLQNSLSRRFTQRQSSLLLVPYFSLKMKNSQGRRNVSWSKCRGMKRSRINLSRNPRLSPKLNLLKNVLLIPSDLGTISLNFRFLHTDVGFMKIN